jgi:hypothetical protein
VFESRVLRRISGARTGEVTGAWRKLHNEQLLFSTVEISRGTQHGMNVGAEERVKLEGERPLGRPRYAWMDDIKMGFRETGWSGMALFDVAEDSDQWMALANAAMEP